MNKKQVNPEMTHAAGHNSQHEQDNCGGCQAERMENQKLVEFYQRLQNIQSKVGKIKSNVGIQQELRQKNVQKVVQMGQLMQAAPEKAIQQIKMQNPKEMGYELAFALIQRQIKAKIQQQRLQSIIQQLQNDKYKLEEQKKQTQFLQTRETPRSSATNSQANHFYHKAVPSRYSDVLDDVRRTNSIDSSYFTGAKKKSHIGMDNSYFAENQEYKNYWEASEGQSDTSFSNFTVPAKQQVAKKSFETGQNHSETQNKNQYEGLNLWLYQFKAEDMDENPIKSLRKPAKKGKMANQNKYKSKF